MTTTEIVKQAKEIRDKLINRSSQFCKYNKIDTALDIIPPFVGKGEIKLIVIGQDPTIQNVNSRKKITTTLNLNKGGALKTYIEEICKALNIELDNVYATNIFKYFYSKPPAQTMRILYEHLSDNLDLLVKEINQYPNAIIVTLGEPVLKLLTDEKEEVKKYWGYNRINNKTQCNTKAFKKCVKNKLKRDFFVLPHVDYKRKPFYKDNMPDYLKLSAN